MLLRSTGNSVSCHNMADDWHDAAAYDRENVGLYMPLALLDNV